MRNKIIQKNDVQSVGKNKLLISTVLLLCCVLLAGIMFAFSACGGESEFDKITAQASEENKPILLYISKKPCPNCDIFKPYWQAFEAEYGDQFIFFTTTINVDSEASKLFKKFNDADDATAKMTGAPSVVWINSQGEYVQRRSGANSCNTELQRTLTNGLANWWTPASA